MAFIAFKVCIKACRPFRVVQGFQVFSWLQPSARLWTFQSSGLRALRAQGPPGLTALAGLGAGPSADSVVEEGTPAIGPEELAVGVGPGGGNGRTARAGFGSRTRRLRHGEREREVGHEYSVGPQAFPLLVPEGTAGSLRKGLRCAPGGRHG